MKQNNTYTHKLTHTNAHSKVCGLCVCMIITLMLCIMWFVGLCACCVYDDHDATHVPSGYYYIYILCACRVIWYVLYVATGHSAPAVAFMTLLIRLYLLWLLFVCVIISCVLHYLGVVLYVVVWLAFRASCVSTYVVAAFGGNRLSTSVFVCGCLVCVSP